MRTLPDHEGFKGTIFFFFFGLTATVRISLLLPSSRSYKIQSFSGPIENILHAIASLFRTEGTSFQGGIGIALVGPPPLHGPLKARHEWGPLDGQLFPQLKEAIIRLAGETSTRGEATAVGTKGASSLLAFDNHNEWSTTLVEVELGMDMDMAMELILQ
jgi:hypothetical protein